MTAYIVEYTRTGGMPWFASREGVTLDRFAASRFSHAEALAHAERTLKTYSELGLKARLTIAQGGVFHDYAARDQPEGLREALRCVPRNGPRDPAAEQGDMR